MEREGGREGSTKRREGRRKDGFLFFQMFWASVYKEFHGIRRRHLLLRLRASALISLTSFPGVLTSLDRLDDWRKTANLAARTWKRQSKASNSFDRHNWSTSLTPWYIETAGRSLVAAAATIMPLLQDSAADFTTS